MARQQLHDVTTDTRQHDKDKVSSQNVLSVNKFRKTQQPSAYRHLETNVAAEPVREAGNPRRVVELRVRTCRLRIKVETSRIIKKITLEKINHETKYIKIWQNQHTDKVVDVTVAVQEQVPPRIKRRTELEKETR